MGAAWVETREETVPVHAASRRQAEPAPQRRQLASRLLLMNRDVQISWFPKRSKDPGFCVKPVNSSSQWVLFYKGGDLQR